MCILLWKRSNEVDLGNRKVSRACRCSPEIGIFCWVLRDTAKLPLTHDKCHYVSRALIVWESPRVAKRAGPVALI